MNSAYDEDKSLINENKEQVYSNTPLSKSIDIINRKTELKNLFKYISPQYRQHITVVNGISGIGKTSFVFQAAKLCEKICEQPKFIDEVAIPKFESVIFIPLKQTYYTVENTVKQIYSSYILQYIFRAITLKLKQDTEEVYKTFGSKQIKAIYQCLNKQQTLLIIDNLDAVKPRERENILIFLSNLPITVQAIVTTREKVAFYPAVSLNALKKDEAIQLIEQEAEKKTISLVEGESLEINQLSDGIPLAILYVLGQKKIAQKQHDLLKETTTDLDLFNDLLTDKRLYLLLKKSIDLLKNPLDYQILILFSFLTDSAPIELIIEVISSDSNAVVVRDRIELLEDLSLINRNKKRYSIHSVTHDFIAKWLPQDINLKKEVRVRWVQWYLTFSAKYGGRDWENWNTKYDRLEIEWNNILGVLEWCATNSDYEKVKNLWHNVNLFANIEKYWSDRIFWLTWLIGESKKREDWQTAAFCLSEKGFTLIQIGNLTEAKLLLKEALYLQQSFIRSSSENIKNQTLICQHFALLHTMREEFEDAYYWLEEEERFIKSMKLSNFRTKEILRRKIAVNTIEAEILYKQKKYREALDKYEQIVKDSAQIGWNRRKVEAQDRIRILRSELSSEKSRYNRNRDRLSKNQQIKRKITDISNHSINLYC